MIPTQFQQLTQSNPRLCIYAVSGLNTGKTLFGQTARGYRKRDGEHFGDLKRNEHGNPMLQNFYNKHGKASLVSFVVDTAQTIEELDAKEKSYIARYKAQGLSFNILPGGSKEEHCRENSAKLAKPYALLDENNKVISGKNITEFCVPNGYAQRLIHDVLKGRKDVAYNFRNIAELGKTYTLVAPKGELVTTDNLVALAKQYGVTASSLYDVVRGRRIHNAGFVLPENYKPKVKRVKMTDEEKKAKARQWYHDHKEEQLAKQKAYYHADAEAINAATWQRRKNNPEALAKTREAKARWRARQKALKIASQV